MTPSCARFPPSNKSPQISSCACSHPSRRRKQRESSRPRGEACAAARGFASATSSLSPPSCAAVLCWVAPPGTCRRRRWARSRRHGCCARRRAVARGSAAASRSCHAVQLLRRRLAQVRAPTRGTGCHGRSWCMQPRRRCLQVRVVLPLSGKLLQTHTVCLHQRPHCWFPAGHAVRDVGQRRAAG